MIAQHPSLLPIHSITSPKSAVARATFSSPTTSSFACTSSPSGESVTSTLALSRPPSSLKVTETGNASCGGVWGDGNESATEGVAGEMCKWTGRVRCTRAAWAEW